MTNPFHRGMSLRQALKDAVREFGCRTRIPRATGEVLVTHVRWRTPVRVNRRRKDAPRELTARLVRLWEDMRRGA